MTFPPTANGKQYVILILVASIVSARAGAGFKF